MLPQARPARALVSETGSDHGELARQDRLIDEEDLPTDCPVFELVAGELVSVECAEQAKPADVVILQVDLTDEEPEPADAAPTLRAALPEAAQGKATSEEAPQAKVEVCAAAATASATCTPTEEGTAKLPEQASEQREADLPAASLASRPPSGVAQGEAEAKLHSAELAAEAEAKLRSAELAEAKQRALRLAEAKQRAAVLAEAIASQDAQIAEAKIKASQLAEAKQKASQLAEAKLRAARLADSLLVEVSSREDEDVVFVAEQKASVTQKRLAGALSQQQRLEAQLGPTVGLERRRRRGPEASQVTAEEERRQEREKRKSLWEVGPDCFQDISDRRRPTTNGWESSDLGSERERRKFLRLLGGRELADATAGLAADVERSDGGELTEEDALIDEEDLPTDCPVFELVEGELVSVEGAAEQDEPAGELAGGAAPSSSSQAEDLGRTPEHAQVLSELERQFQQGVMRQASRRRVGLGAV